LLPLPKLRAFKIGSERKARGTVVDSSNAVEWQFECYLCERVRRKRGESGKGREGGKEGE
jgi:hypothetical protein